jgi:hypothetical protein
VAGQITLTPGLFAPALNKKTPTVQHCSFTDGQKSLTRRVRSFDAGAESSVAGTRWSAREAKGLAGEVLSVIAPLLFALQPLRVAVQQAVVAVVLAALSRRACGVGGFALQLAVVGETAAIKCPVGDGGLHCAVAVALVAAVVEPALRGECLDVVERGAHAGVEHDWRGRVPAATS